METIHQSRQQLVQEMDKAENKYCANRPQVLTIIWLLIQVCVFCLAISSFALSGNAAYVFLGVLITFLAIALSIFGTLILRKHRTTWHHGLLVGVSFMMSMAMLMSAIFAGTRTKCEDTKDSAQAAVCAFSIFLFFFYLIFFILLLKWQDDIIGVDIDAEIGEGQNIESGTEEDTDLKMV